MSLINIIYKNSLTKLTKNFLAKRNVCLSSNLMSDALYVHREHDVDIDKFEFSDENKKVKY